MNRNLIVNTIIFASGLAVGSIATWLAVKKYYMQQAREEIDSFKETYHKTNVTKEKPNLSDYAEDIKKEEEESIKSIHPFNKPYINYGSFSGSPTEDEEEEKSMNEPYVISPNEFGEKDNYDKIEFTYYSDGVLVDENDKEVKDFDRIIGQESLTHFGEYEDDSVYVRNDILRCDYEILADQRSYEDVLNVKPYLKNDG